MRISINEAQKLTNVPLMPTDTSDLSEKIGRQLGAVEEVVDWAARYEGILVAKVISCKPHPNADKLKVCLIDDGHKVKDVNRNDQDLIEVVCGGVNVAEGQTIAWIPPGVIVPETYGSKNELRLEVKELRGVQSNGMIASARELGISPEHDGILEITPDEGVTPEQMKPGTPFIKLYNLDDIVFELENKMFTHRPDCFGMLGVARELAGIQGQAFKSPSWYLQDPAFKTASGLELKVNVEAKELVPRFMAVAIQGVEVKPSPIWLQALLTRLGTKPVNNVVDVTNYVMHLTGQPLHAFDYDKVAKNSLKSATLIARKSKNGEKLTLLGGKDIYIEQGSLVIATDKLVLGLAGVMGGVDTEVDNSTKNIILECANFDMYAIRKSAMAHGLFTEAYTRFSKGQSPLQNDRVLAYALEQILTLAGGSQASTVNDIHIDLKKVSDVRLTAPFINDRLGGKLGPATMAELLKNVEFDVSLREEELTVKPPFWRTDVQIPEDVVEEVGRLHGFHNLPVKLPMRPSTPAIRSNNLDLAQDVRRILTSAGMSEVLSYTFVSKKLMESCGVSTEGLYVLRNALSPDLQVYRPTIIPSLLEKVYPNHRQKFDSLALFEINQIINQKEHDATEPDLPHERTVITCVFSLSDKLAGSRHDSAYYLAKYHLEYLLNRLGLEPKFLSYKPFTDNKRTPWLSYAGSVFNINRVAEIEYRSKLIGLCGEFSRLATKNLKLPRFGAGFEVDLDAISEILSDIKFDSGDKNPPMLPTIEHDITLSVRSESNYAEIVGILDNKLKRTDIEITINSLDIYKKDVEDQRRITVRVKVQPLERTLTTDEVNHMVDNAVEEVVRTTGAVRI